MLEADLHRSDYVPFQAHDVAPSELHSLSSTDIPILTTSSLSIYFPLLPLRSLRC